MLTLSLVIRFFRRTPCRLVQSIAKIAEIAKESKLKFSRKPP
jgi:hypothetical protein